VKIISYKRKQSKERQEKYVAITDGMNEDPAR
jgi:hypothetical protein